MYKPRHEGQAHREPRFDPAATSFDVFNEARPYVRRPRPRLARPAPMRLDVLRSPLSLLIVAGMVENPIPAPARVFTYKANELPAELPTDAGLPVFSETVRVLGRGVLHVEAVKA